MENQLRSFDVCIVCALPEEVRAFLTIVKPHCEDCLEEHISPHYGYSYRSAVLKNDKNELLALHISWLPRYGQQEMTLHLSRVLEECQPRIAIMTGICAGDAKQVRLGDLVVAERTFTYDNGKFVLDEQGLKVHLHDTLTYQLDANILQFLGLFDDWKPFVAQLEGPPSMLDQQETACHIKAMASGSAVRADNPFQDVQAPVRGTVAIDMEGAAFSLVMSRHALTRWLIVKGVCDYADRAKNDAYHDYAARASASYALRFIQAYVTNERLPSPNEPSSSSRAGPSSVWNVPYSRNPHFTGREELLNQLSQRLTPAGPNDPAKIGRVALTHPQAIKGLGGIGKSQIAVEFAYRSRDLGRYRHTLWVNAATEETIIASLREIAELLPSFSAKSETNLRKLVEAIKRWLEQCTLQWLLIFDNVDNVDSLPVIQEYLPQEGNGSVLITTRANAVGSFAASLEVEKMGLIEGTQFLLHRTQRFDQASDEVANEATNVVIALDCFPLALDQAGAYIEETECSFSSYLQFYQTHRKKLLLRRGLQTTDYPDSVATTWSLSFQKVEQANPAAAELLRLCAFLAPDTIPEELIRNGVSCWSPKLKQVAADPFKLNMAFEELLKFSLMRRQPETETLSIHRLVQAVLKDVMKRGKQRQWAERVVQAVSSMFPNAKDATTWPQCLRYLSQSQACQSLIKDYEIINVAAMSLQTATATYLQKLALYTVAEPLYQYALEISKQLTGMDHPATVLCLDYLAMLYRDQGRYEQAEQLWIQALEISRRVCGMDYSTTAICLKNLAMLYKDQRKYEQAEQLWLQALESCKNVWGNSPYTLECFDNLAMLYGGQGKYEQAEHMSQQALAGCEHLEEYLKEQGWEEKASLIIASLSKQTALITLSIIYQYQEKYEQAEPLAQQALENSERVLGSDHPEVANNLKALAMLYIYQGKSQQAELLLHRALEISERVLGSDHPDTVDTLNILDALYHNQEALPEQELVSTPEEHSS